MFGKKLHASCYESFKIKMASATKVSGFLKDIISSSCTCQAAYKCLGHEMDHQIYSYSYHLLLQVTIQCYTLYVGIRRSRSDKKDNSINFVVTCSLVRWNYKNCCVSFYACFYTKRVHTRHTRTRKNIATRNKPLRWSYKWTLPDYVFYEKYTYKTRLLLY